MKTAILDFETRSRIDLKTAGPWKYAAHPSTEILCWVAKDQDWNPIDSLLDVANADVISAHNAEFERAIWHHKLHGLLGLPDIPLENWSCTAAQAATLALPRDLATVCQVLGLNYKKDMEGHRLMLRMCKPNSKGEWVDSPEKRARLKQYCESDVNAEVELHRLLLPLTDKERSVWLLDQEINRRGVFLDTPAIEDIIATLKKNEAGLLAEFQSLTGLNSPRQRDALIRWLSENGVSTFVLDKSAVGDLLKTDITPKVRRALELRQFLSVSSVAKFKAMADRADADNRARALFMYHGAGTGRWSGKSVQTQNLPRASYDPEELEVVLKTFEERDVQYVELMHGPVSKVASKCVRGCITAPPGSQLMAADFSAIEARGLAYLAKEQKVLDAFARGLDIYKVAAGAIYGKQYADIAKDERQVGKVSVLSCGYQGWIKAFQAMAANYGVRIPDEVAKLVISAWRREHREIVGWWSALQNTAIATISTCRAHSTRGPVEMAIRVVAGSRFLRVKIPSGRCLYYFKPHLVKEQTPRGMEQVIYFWGVDSYTKQWTRQTTYGGSLAENIVQAFCRDLLVEAMLRVPYPIVAHVHDEIVCEVPCDLPKTMLKSFEQTMSEVPSWAVGMPIAAEGWMGKRYRK